MLFDTQIGCVLLNIGVPYGSRTRVAAVKGRCPRPLDERDARGGLNKLTYKFGECQTCYKQSISYEKAQKSQEEIGYQKSQKKLRQNEITKLSGSFLCAFCAFLWLFIPWHSRNGDLYVHGTHAKGEYSRGQIANDWYAKYEAHERRKLQRLI